jgi:hypothetical protein
LFWINIPIGLVVIAGVLLVTNQLSEARPHRFHVDALGLVLYVAAILAVIYGLTILAEDPTLVGSPLVYGLFASALLMGIVLVWHVHRAKDPIMDYTLLARSPFLPANLYNALLGAMVVGPYSFLPLYAVVKFGLSPFESGAVLTPRALTAIGTSLVSSMLILPLGYRLPMVVGMVLASVNLVLLGTGAIGVQLGGLVINGFWFMAAALCVGGVGLGLANPAANNAALDLAPTQAAAITGIRAMFRLAGGALSISVITVALSFTADQAAGLANIFLWLAASLVVSVPLTLMIPDAPRRRRLTGDSAGQ